MAQSLPPQPHLTYEYQQGYRAYPGKCDLMTPLHWQGWEAARCDAELALQFKVNDIQDVINGSLR